MSTESAVTKQCRISYYYRMKSLILWSIYQNNFRASDNGSTIFACTLCIIKLDTIQKNFFHTHWTELYMLLPEIADVHRNISAHIFAADIFLHHFAEICHYEIKEDSCWDASTYSFSQGKKTKCIPR